MLIHTLLLGFPMKRSYINLGAINKFSGAVAGEANDVFTRGVLHFLSLYFVFSLLCFTWFCLPLFQKTQKISLAWFACLIQKHKKFSSFSSCCCCFWLAHLCQN